MPRWLQPYRWILLGLGLALAACAPAAIPTATLAPTNTFTPAPTNTAPPPSATPTTASTATDTPEPTSTASPTATAQPTELFTAEQAPVLRSRFPNAQVFIDPGAVVFHDGMFHMFYNGINGFPAPVGVGHATSTDGRTWTRASDEPVFGPATDDYPIEMRSTNLFVTSGLVEPDGTWVLYYYTLGPSGNFDGRQTIGRATAPSPEGPWTYNAEPVLEPGPEGAWDSQQVSAPDVTRLEDGSYVMYYDASAKGSPTWMIGRATSPDGITWTKYDDPATTSAALAESDPVLRPSPADWDDTRALDPNVHVQGDQWVMIYATNHGPGGKFAGKRPQLGYATSPDGITWTKSATPLVLAELHPGWQAIYLVSAVHEAGMYYLYFDVATGGTNVHMATYEGELGNP